MMSSEPTDPLQRAQRLTAEADQLLHELDVHGILGAYGRVVPTGSYFLDVMVYPDIDLYIPPVSMEQLFAIGGRLALSPLVFQVVVEKDLDGTMAGGLYLKPRVRFGDWGRPWKIDIWSLDDAALDERMEPMLRFREEMTPPLREAILHFKTSILTHEHRTPKYSGFWIYRAFLDEGLTDPGAVTRFLEQHGISVEQDARSGLGGGACLS
jgi:hypothetical protein